MAENKMEQVESLLIWLASGEKDEDGNFLSDDDTQLVCEALEYYLNMHGQKNKMEQVAAMFGKKLNEPFYLKDHKSVCLPYVFTESGMYFLNHGKKDINDYYRLLKLLIGNAEIVEDE